MKKTAAIMMAAMLALAATACGSQNKDNGTSSLPMESSSGMESMEPGSAESSMPSSEMPSDTGSDTVSVFIKDPQLKSAFEAVRSEFGEFYISMPSVVTEQQMQEMYYISPDDIEEFVGEMSLVNTSGDTFVGVKAKPGRAEAVADALEKRKADIVKQFAEYPVNFMDVKSQAAKVVTLGDDYVFLLLMGHLDVPDGEDASLKMAQDEVDRAEKALRTAFDGGEASASTGSAK